MAKIEVAEKIAYLKNQPFIAKKTWYIIVFSVVVILLISILSRNEYTTSIAWNSFPLKTDFHELMYQTTNLLSFNLSRLYILVLALAVIPVFYFADNKLLKQYFTRH